MGPENATTSFDANTRLGAQFLMSRECSYIAEVRRFLTHRSQLAFVFEGLSEVPRMYYPMFKRLADLTGATVGLAIAAIPMMAIAGVIRQRMGPPVLYRVRRPGLHARPFVLLKFRTMTNAIDASGKPLPDKDRVTSVGRFLRRTSLDELPQLVNVLRGEMSMVGPRPLNDRYLDLYTPEQARRHHVRPGITGLAQVSGRNALSWEERFRLDVQYADHVNLIMDVRILLQTLVKVLRRDSVTPDGDLDVPSFTGSPARNQTSAG